MTLKTIVKWILVLIVGLLAVQASAEEPPLLKTQNDKLNYATGVDIAKDLKERGIEVDVDLMTKGLNDMLSGQKLSVTKEDLRAVMTAFHVELTLMEAPAKRVSPNVSYGIGVEVGRSLKWYGFTFNADLVARGLKDILSGQKLAMTEADIRVAMSPFQAKWRTTRMTALRLTPEDRKKEQVFRSENLKKEGVVTLKSGLQYKILKAGEGRKPTDTDTVEVRYRGTFIDGIEFGSSPRDGQPVTLKIAKAIPGWREALKLMPVGSKWQIYIPPRLIYREGGWDYLTRANETLIFELELVAVTMIPAAGKDPAPAGPPAAPK
jgi:FKBP-type peptidyl-prolyl cis-trans isomerase